MWHGMCYVAAGLDVLNEATSSIHAAIRGMDESAQEDARRMRTAIYDLADEVARTNFLLETVVENQRAVLEVLRSPLATQAAELLRRAAWAAERGLWPEAIGDYDKAIELDWTQSAAHYGRGLALLAQHGRDDAARGRWIDAVGSLEKAARYAGQSEPSLAVSAIQLAVIWHDRLGDAAAGDKQLTWATQQLTRSPELAFSAALRFRAPVLLERALKLDPRLTADPVWQSLPVAEEVVKNLHLRQIAVQDAASAALSEAKPYGVAAVAASPPPKDCVRGFAALATLKSELDDAQAVVARPTAEEDELADRCGAGAARASVVRSRITAADHKRMPWWRVIVAWLMLPLLAPMVVGGIVAGAVGGPAGFAAADSYLLPTFVIALVVAIVVVPIVVFLKRSTVSGFHGARHRVIERGTSKIERQLADLRARREKVLCGVATATDRVSALITRSADAYGLPGDPPAANVGQR